MRRVVTRYCLPVALALAVSACASNVDVQYPGPAHGPAGAGALLIRFTEPMKAVSVSVDGVLVAEDKHTERVHVGGVPAGYREVGVVAAAGGRAAPVERVDTVNVAPGQEVSILVASPARSLGSWILAAAYAVGYAVMIATTDWWRD